MADAKRKFQKRTEASKTVRLRTMMVSGVVAMTSASMILMSEPKNAAASGEACFDQRISMVDRDHVISGLFGLDAFAKGVQGDQAEAGMFWNPVSKSWLTEQQQSLLKMAYEIGYADGGESHAELLQAVMMQETAAGLLGRIGHMSAPVGKRSYGVMQVKVTAARDVFQYLGEPLEYRSDEELITHLMSDDKFNISVASKFLLMLKEKTRSSDQLLVAYNIGLTGSRSVTEASTFKYVVKVRRHMNGVVKPFNDRFVAAGENSARGA